MNGWKPATLIACFALAAACGGGQEQSQTPTNPSATATETSTAPTSAPTSTTSAAPTSTTAPTTSAPTTGGGSSGGPAAGGAVNWDAMSHEQKLDYMKNTVMPKMKAEFQAQDAAKFAKFTCGTCHGAGAKDGTFKMPSPDLPKLDMTNQFAKHKAKTPAMMDFMFKQVEPDMAALLGEKPFDPSTGQGFGCFDCHTKQ